jgi:hypothetical protein
MPPLSPKPVEQRLRAPIDRRGDRHVALCFEFECEPATTSYGVTWTLDEYGNGHDAPTFSTGYGLLRRAERPGVEACDVPAEDHWVLAPLPPYLGVDPREPGSPGP